MSENDQKHKYLHDNIYKDLFIDDYKDSQS